MHHTAAPAKCTAVGARLERGVRQRISRRQKPALACYANACTQRQEGETWAELAPRLASAFKAPRAGVAEARRGHAAVIQEVDRHATAFVKAPRWTLRVLCPRDAKARTERAALTFKAAPEDKRTARLALKTTTRNHRASTSLPNE